MLATLYSLFPLSLRRQLAGGLILAAMAMIAAGLLGLGIAPHWAGLAYWCAAALLWPGLAKRNRTQALVLLLVGGGCLVWSAGQGAEVDPQRLVAGNSGLLSMLVAVSFLSLVSRPQTEDDERSPKGKRALASTLAAVHLFGSVINLSSVFIIGDRLSRRGSVTREQALVLIRGFTAAAFWSPFFVAMAVSLSVAPDARLATLWLVSMPLALCSLLLPGLLAAAVLTLHELKPALSILAVITLMAPALTLAILTVKRQRPLAVVAGLVSGRLPQMGNELALFLAAGVLGYGLETLFSTLGGSLPLTHFGPVEASVTYSATVVLSLLGIHPIICISLAGAVLMPLEPDHTLLALVFLSSWAVGTSTGPLSGINLAFQGRYGLDSFRIMRWNLGYAAAMSALVVVAIFVLAALPGLA
ncbi:hypothetical protein [Oceanimonas marisflavi]|uniref:hypothetical protein n=1 Tax=Oceanimonas marisflavi TaxID=2059724 RepID=UPI000D30C25B|nr:hypothetical protein [Oceanimonas marisflavi]